MRDKKEAALRVLLDEKTCFDMPCESCHKLSKAVYGNPYKACDETDCWSAFRTMVKEAFCKEGVD